MPLHKTLFHDRTVISVKGDDRVTYLQGIVTQNISRPEADRGLYGALLTPQGKLIADFFILPVDGEILLDCNAEIGPKLLTRLKLYKLRAQVEVTDVSEHWHVGAIWSSGEDAPLPNIPDSLATFDDPRLEKLGKRILIDDSTRVDFAAIAADETTPSAYETHCLLYGIPAFGSGFTSEQVFPLDANLDALNGVDYKKGCFVGQEVASRMKRKGEVRKRTWVVTSEEGLLAPGQSIMSGETTIGEITAADRTNALALVRLDRLAKATEAFTAGGSIPVTLHQPAYLGDKA